MQVEGAGIEERVQRHAETLRALEAEIAKVVVGQKDLVSRLLMALLCDGHVLLEGVPGLAKTTVVNTLARAMQGSFSRIQFTPDLLPSDVVGTLIYSPQTSTFSVKKGPIFANVVLADEINRAPSKVQSALLEAMQERQVTIGDETHALGSPFLVMATQNPIEQEGTYPLPEAQVDRFMIKVLVDYLEPEEELQVVERALSGRPATVNPVLTPEGLAEAKETLGLVQVEESVLRYVIDLVATTRDPQRHGLTDLVPLIEHGASPRASIWLTAMARARAFLRGKRYVTADDVKAIARDVLRHRVLLTYEAEAEGISADQVVDKLLDNVPVP